MTRYLGFMAFSLLLSACTPRYEQTYQPPSGSATATITGTAIDAKGWAAVGGLLSENGFVDVLAVDGQKVTTNNISNNQLLGVFFAGSSFNPVALEPGRRELDLFIMHGSHDAIVKMTLPVQAGDRYQIKAQGGGWSGHVWVENQHGQRTQPVKFRFSM